MRALILIAALALSACASAPPPTPVQAAAVTRSVGVATLALWGSWEWEIAPAYTRLIVLQKRTAKALDNGRISVDTAETIDATLARARTSLLAARRGNAATPTDAQRADHAEALRIIEIAEHLLEPRP